MFADFEGDSSKLLTDGKEGVLPVLTTRDMVLFPGVLVPILLGRKASIGLSRYMSDGSDDRMCAIVSQINPDVDFPKEQDIYHYGVYGKLVRVIEMQGSDNVTAIYQALGRCHLDKVSSYSPWMKAHVTPLPEQMPDENDREFKTIVEDIKSSTENLVSMSDDIPDEIIEIEADKLQLSRVITNLINNAIKHNDKGTRIGIILERDYNSLHLMIADNGKKIDDDMAEHIFEPFYMGDESRNSRGGTGLGLSIAERIISLHGFKIKLIRSPFIKKYPKAESYEKMFMITMDIPDAKELTPT